jgi:hypothetical protein
VRGGGAGLGADEGGEPGREDDRDSIEPQARVGAVLLDVRGGEPGQARGELAVEQQERPGGPDVERDARVAQAPAEQLPAAVFGDEPVPLGRGRAGTVALPARRRALARRLWQSGSTHPRTPVASAATLLHGE